MSPRKRVKCACKCGGLVTTSMEADHLQKKHYLKAKLVPSIVRKRRSILHPAKPDSARSKSPTSSPPVQSLPPFNDNQEPAPGPSGGQIEVPDHTGLWERVFATRVTVSDDEDISNRSEELFSDDFKSQSNSDDEAQPEDVPEAQLNPLTQGIPPDDLLRQDMLVRGVVDAPNLLSSSQIGDIGTFDFIVKHKLSVSTYHDMQDRFVLKHSHSSLPSLRQLRTRVLALSGLKPVLFDCCKDSCVLFAGPFSELNACPECNIPRRNSAGAPQNTFEFFPPIPQLRAQYCDPKACEAMQYRHNYPENTDILDDIFGARRYQELRRTHVVIDGVQQPFKYFENSRDIALGLSTDGMCPFKRRKKSCWPLILVNYNLPPEERTHVDNLICVGVIPGPKSPKNMSSFLWPLVEQLIELAAGVTAVDALNRELFLMRGYLLTIFGDIPAMTKMLEFVGHNGRFPCRFCLILAIRAVTANGGTHLYCPLHRSSAPFFDPLNLPLRTHEDTLKQGFDILDARNPTARNRLATETGVKGISALARIPSISVPESFPIDIMHMVFLNLIPQLVELWTGEFHEFGAGKEKYTIPTALWKAIGTTVEQSGSTIPSSFGCRVPDLSLPSHGNAIAESWNIFATHLAPSLLRRRFRKPKYYHHFVRLIKLLNQCTSLDGIPRSEIPALRQGFAKWVQDYERYYYQHNPDRMQVCTVNIHYLLHLVDSIEAFGPPGAYWSFLMERFCSLVGSVVKSRRHPFENITRSIRDRMHLKILRHLYGSHQSLAFMNTKREGEDDVSNADMIPGYPRACLFGACAALLVVTTQLRNKISAYLGTTFETDGEEARQLIPDQLKEWRRLRISQGGDLIQAAACQKLRADARDSSFVRYELLVDKIAHRFRAQPRFERASQYGQLQRIFALPLPPHTRVNPLPTEKTLLLALISEAPVEVEHTHEYTVVYYEKPLKSGEVVDAQAIQCVVGRAFDKDRYWIIDRADGSKLTFPDFV